MRASLKKVGRARMLFDDSLTGPRRSEPAAVSNAQRLGQVGIRVGGCAELTGRFQEFRKGYLALPASPRTRLPFLLIVPPMAR